MTSAIILLALNFSTLPSIPATHHLEPITLAVTGSTVITASTLTGGNVDTDAVVESSSGAKSYSIKDLLITHALIAWPATGKADFKNILFAIKDIFL